MESPYETMARIMTEPAYAFDDLRIIAGNVPITKMDRARLREIADEIESTCRTCIALHQALIESDRTVTALRELMAESQRNKAPLLFSVSSGWMPVIPTPGINQCRKS